MDQDGSGTNRLTEVTTLPTLRPATGISAQVRRVFARFHRTVTFALWPGQRRRYRPSRRSRCEKERSARKKSTRRKSGQYASQK